MKGFVGIRRISITTPVHAKSLTPGGTARILLIHATVIPVITTELVETLLARTFSVIALKVSNRLL